VLAQRPGRGKASRRNTCLRLGARAILVPPSCTDISFRSSTAGGSIISSGETATINYGKSLRTSTWWTTANHGHLLFLFSTKGRSSRLRLTSAVVLILESTQRCDQRGNGRQIAFVKPNGHRARRKTCGSTGRSIRSDRQDLSPIIGESNVWETESLTLGSSLRMGWPSARFWPTMPAHSEEQRPMTRRAFTLVELLVVIAIIGGAIVKSC